MLPRGKMRVIACAYLGCALEIHVHVLFADFMDFVVLKGERKVR